MTRSPSNMNRDTAYEVVKSCSHLPAWAENLSRAGVPEADVQLLETLDAERRDTIRDLERGWRAAVRPMVNALKDDVSASERAWAQGRRKEYLTDEAARMGQEIAHRYAEYEKSAQSDEPLTVRLIALPEIQDLEAKLSRIKSELKAISSGKESKAIPSEKIERARAVPLSALVPETERDMMLCPLHDDRSASMWIKGGFGYCFSCGGHLDSIGYMMKVRGLGFREAVEALQ